jgi:predicted nucleic acid-binding protein
MNRVIVVDSGPLGLVTQRKGVAPADACRQWVGGCIRRGARMIVPAIADYEVRRELERAGKVHGLARLDAFNAAAPDRYLPLSDAALRLAATLWARARKAGTPTADPKELDCDVLIAAQALTLGAPAGELVIATVNVGHFSQFVNAEPWTNIQVA